MGTITRGTKSAGGTDFSTGDIIAAEVNTDLNTAYNEINGNLDNANIDASAAIALTKLAGVTSHGQDLMTSASVAATRSTLSVSSIAEAASYARGHIGGYVMSRDSGQVEKDLNLTAGACVDSTGVMFMQRAEITKQIDATWASGDDAGGMNDGESATADTWYHVFVLSNADGSTVDAGFDSDIDATNLLADAAVVTAGLTLYRRVGSILLDSTPDIIGFTQVGDTFLWDDPPQDVDDSTSGTTAENYALSTPPDVKCEAIFNARFAVTGTNTVLYLASPDSDDEAPANSAAPLATVFTITSKADQWAQRVWTDTSSQIRGRGSINGQTLEIATLGWRDLLGRWD